MKNIIMVFILITCIISLSLTLRGNTDTFSFETFFTAMASEEAPQMPSFPSRPVLNENGNFWEDTLSVLKFIGQIFVFCFDFAVYVVRAIGYLINLIIPFGDGSNGEPIGGGGYGGGGGGGRHALIGDIIL